MDVKRERPFWGGAGACGKDSRKKLMGAESMGEFYLEVAYIRMDISCRIHKMTHSVLWD